VPEAPQFDRPDVRWHGGKEMPTPHEMLDAARWLVSEAESILRSDWSITPTEAQADALWDAREQLSQVKATIDRGKDR
jgi:hypothetical protein